ncbi:MAG: hypothetical protein AB8B64_02905 [Granulosicoccus sp.]
MSDLWIKIPIALFCIFFIAKLFPLAVHWIKHGPYGSSKEWLNVSMLLGAVVLFVTFLITTVQS